MIGFINSYNSFKLKGRQKKRFAGFTLKSVILLQINSNLCTVSFSCIITVLSWFEHFYFLMPILTLTLYFKLSGRKEVPTPAIALRTLRLLHLKSFHLVNLQLTDVLSTTNSQSTADWLMATQAKMICTSYRYNSCFLQDITPFAHQNVCFTGHSYYFRCYTGVFFSLSHMLYSSKISVIHMPWCGWQSAKMADWWMVNDVNEVDFHTATTHISYM